MEWFGEVEHYQVMQTDVFDSPTTGETYEHIVDHALDSVLNWGLGLERHLSSGVTLYGSYVKDNSAYAGADKSSVSVSTWDLHHLMGGAGFRVAGTDFTLGVGYA